VPATAATPAPTPDTRSSLPRAAARLLADAKQRQSLNEDWPPPGLIARVVTIAKPSSEVHAGD
jgi:hypothetical protein